MNSANTHRVSFLLFTLFLIGLLTTAPAVAQIKTGIKLLNKGDYAEAMSAFETDLTGDEVAKIIAHYNIGKIYFAEDFGGHNLDSAFYHVNTAGLLQKKMDNSNRSKLSKADADYRMQRTNLRKIVQAAYKQYAAEGTLEAYDHFLTFYEGADRTSESKMSKLRNSLAYKKAVEEDSPEVYEAMLEKYRTNMSKKSPDAYKKMQYKHFESYIREHSWADYDAFAEAFPYNVYVRDEARGDFEKAKAKNTVHAYKTFVKLFPESAYVHMAANEMASLLIRGNNLDDCEYFVINHADHERVNDVWKRFYQLYVKQNGRESIRLFKYTYTDYPFQKQIDKDMNSYDKDAEDKAWMIAKSKNSFDSYHEFYNNFQLSERLEEAASRMYDIIVPDSSITQYSFFVDSFPVHEKTDSMWMKLYRLYVGTNGPKSVLRFEKYYPDFPFKEALAADKEKAIEIIRKEKKAKAGGR